MVGGYDEFEAFFRKISFYERVVAYFIDFNLYLMVFY